MSVKQTSFCDNHSDELAQALCKSHKKLLCISCVLQEAKSSECSITEIRKISGEQDTALYEGLLVRQIAINKKHLIEEHENKTEELKNTLKKQITDFHEQLMMSLNKTKDDCLKTVEEHADAIVKQNKHSKEQVETFMKVITENLEKFSTESSFDPSRILTKFNEVKTTLLKEVPDLDSVLEGKFEENQYLKDTLSKSKFTLGNVYLIAQDRYAQVGNETDLNAERGEDVTDKGEINDSVKHKLATYVTSDEVLGPTELNKGSQTKKINVAMSDSSKTHQENDNKKQEPTCDKEENRMIKASQDVKEPKRRKGILGWFHRNTPDSEKKEKDSETEAEIKILQESSATQNPAQNLAEGIYQVTSFDTIENHQLRSLINKTVSIDGMQRHFRTALKFSTIVYLGSGYLGLLSRAHDLVVLTSLDGQFHAKKTIPGLSNIVACGREHVAVIKIVDKNLQVIKFKVGNKKFETVGSFSVNVDVPKVTGLDFDVASSKFAVSSPGKLGIFKNMTIVRETKYPIGRTDINGEVVTTYDFSKDCLFLLDSQNRTLKCFSFSRDDYLWKIQIDGQHKARNFCLYEDKLCITNGKAVGIFNAKDGKAVLKHDTCDLLDDCDGICVIDGVIVLPSNSSDIATSTKLAFISM